jgi:parallel beta-helix repeat protein
VQALLASAALSLTLAAGADAAQPVTVHCGQVITEDTKLANDLIDCPEHGLVIGADDVSLDLNGHTIDGDAIDPDTCRVELDCHDGVHNAAGHDAVTITGGSVRDFTTGVLVVGASDNHIRALTASDSSAHGVYVGRTTDSTIARNSVFDNFSGVVVVESRDIAVVDNSVSDSQLGGIPIFESQHVRIAGNSSSGNGLEGIALLDRSSDNAIERNSLSDNGDGISSPMDRIEISSRTTRRPEAAE